MIFIVVIIILVIVILVLSCTISDILQVFVLMTTPLFHLNFGMFPLDQIADVEVNVSRCLKLFGREIIFEVFHPMGSRYLNVTDRQADGQTDEQTTYCGITALCVASRGKK